MRSPRPVSASTTKAWLADRKEIALLDVREAGEFASGHPLFATSVPFGVLEARLPALAPSKACRLVFLDDGYSGRAWRAAEIASGLGYSATFFLDGGAAGWQRSDFTLFEGVHVPSKAFGELVEATFSVPHITAQALSHWQKAGRKLVLLDGRPLEEHRRMNVPGSICLPNGELAYRAGAIIGDPETPVVIHCAGRTRSIVGAQILRDLGFANPVLALENGTQGWVLAGLELEHGSERQVEAAPTDESLAEMRIQARSLGDQWGIPFIEGDTAGTWLLDQNRTTCLFDVRSEAEFQAGHIDGAVHAPGGQLLQSTDQWVAVRRGRLILADDTGLRAVVVARFLRMMGLDCYVLPAIDAGWAGIAPQAAGQVAMPELPNATLPLQDNAIILDSRSSTAYRSAHVSGALWILRHQLDEQVKAFAKTSPLILCGDNHDAMGLIARDLKSRGFDDLTHLPGTPVSWREAGLDVVSTPREPSDAQALDFIFFTHDRHSGNLEAARRYLSWETGLVARLDDAELAELSRAIPGFHRAIQEP